MLVGLPLFPLGTQQAFSTLPSRQLLDTYEHEHEQPAPPTAAPAVATAAAATAAAATSSSPRDGNDDNASSQSYTPHSRGLDASWRTQASSGISVSASTSQPLEHPSVAGAGGYAEGYAEAKGEDGRGWSGSGALSWNDEDGRRGAPVALRCASSRELQFLYLRRGAVLLESLNCCFCALCAFLEQRCYGQKSKEALPWLMLFPELVEYRVNSSRRWLSRYRQNHLRACFRRLVVLHPVLPR